MRLGISVLVPPGWGSDRRYWTGPFHPNDTYYDNLDAGCPDGCLFNISEDADPTEHTDLRISQPERFQLLLERLLALGCKGFGIILDHVSRISQPRTASHAPCTILHLATMRMEC